MRGGESHPASYGTLLGPPLPVKLQLIGKTCRHTFELEGGRVQVFCAFAAGTRHPEEAMSPVTR